MLDQHLEEDKAQFVTAFRAADLSTTPDHTDRSALTRWTRRVLVYRALLKKAHFTLPNGFTSPVGRNLFGADLVAAMQGSPHPDKAAEFAAAGAILGNLSSGRATTWDQLINALQGLHSFITTRDSGWTGFNTTYLARSSSGQSWADADLLGLLGMIGAQNGAVRLRAMADRHGATVTEDYAVKILNDLHSGRLVIVDQSLGDEDLNQIVADRIIEFIFKAHQKLFSSSAAPPQIMVYVEEHIIDYQKDRRPTPL
jgi:hypothetical protein